MIDFNNITIPNINRLLTKSNVAKTVFYARILFIAVIVISIAISAWLIVDRSLSLGTQVLTLENKVQATVASIKGSKDTESTIIDVSKITDGNIFGEMKGASLAGNSDNAKPVSNVALSLVGTFIDSADPYAIIQDDKKKQQDIFSLNESIFDVATLIKVEADRVEIKRDGKEEVLFLDEGGSAGGSASGGSGSASSGGTIGVDANKLDEALDNLPLLLTQARAVPYFKDGKSVGLRLFAIKTGSLFQEIGLKNGDILKDINGSSLADITQAVKLFERLKEEKAIDLTLERGKKDVVYNYEIR